MTIEFNKTEEYERLQKYFAKYDSQQGPNTVGSEIVLALMHIVNSYICISEKVNTKKKCSANAALRFIVSEIGVANLSDFVKTEGFYISNECQIELLKSKNYDKWLIKFVRFIIDTLDKCQGWFTYNLVPNYGWRSYSN